MSERNSAISTPNPPSLSVLSSSTGYFNQCDLHRVLSLFLFLYLQQLHATMENPVLESILKRHNLWVLSHCIWLLLPSTIQTGTRIACKCFIGLNCLPLHDQAPVHIGKHFPHKRQVDSHSALRLTGKLKGKGKTLIAI